MCVVDLVLLTADGDGWCAACVGGVSEAQDVARCKATFVSTRRRGDQDNENDSDEINVRENDRNM